MPVGWLRWKRNAWKVGMQIMISSFSLTQKLEVVYDLAAATLRLVSFSSSFLASPAGATGAFFSSIFLATFGKCQNMCEQGFMRENVPW
jgi:hypothetical protein